MPTGTPLSLKCPKCKRGKWGKDRSVKHCMQTGRTEDRVFRSAHKGHGGGGSSFWGFRGEVKCGDCGHTWFSTHPSSGRKTWCKCVSFDGSRFRGKWHAKPNCKICKGSGKVTELERRS